MGGRGHLAHLGSDGPTHMNLKLCAAEHGHQSCRRDAATVAASSRARAQVTTQNTCCCVTTKVKIFRESPQNLAHLLLYNL